TEFIHQIFAARSRRQTKRSTRRNRIFHNRAHWGVHGAQEELQIGTATNLDERVKLMHLKAAVVLFLMIHQVRKYRHFVLQVLTHRDRDRLAPLVQLFASLVMLVISVAPSNSVECDRQRNQEEEQASAALHFHTVSYKKLNKTYHQTNGYIQ